MKKYSVNNIFYSLQGEGRNAGRAAVFVRFSGCNLSCPFCDTDFSQYTEMTVEEIIDKLKEVGPSLDVKDEKMLCVLTGGEPTLQVDETLINQLHQEEYVVAMESNGTKIPPSNLDWLTVSPKGRPVVKHCNELKVIFDERMQVDDYGMQADFYYLQPCDTGNQLRNVEITTICVEYIKQHPRWQLSLQTHKLIGIE